MNLNITALDPSTYESFNFLLFVMGFVAVLVFVALYFIEAGYGKMISAKWGPAINNKVAWFIMEAPVFLVMFYFWSHSSRQWDIAPLLFFLFFQFHYLQRAFIFPFLLKGNSKMPISIIIMGIIFNTVNGYLQGQWIFFHSPEGMYSEAWLLDPRFIIGSIIFFIGMIINLHSDHVIRHLRELGDTNHYLPNKGLYKYVTSANYFGEIVEWTGFAILTWSIPGLIFVMWTFANLVPRANSIYKKYKEEFGEEFTKRPLKRVFPFIY